METLHNELLTVEVSDLGAELQSIKDDEGKEYLWQGDDRYWGRRSPILFPIVCGLWKGTYRTEGDTYQMGRHGFARDMNFRVLKKADDRVSNVQARGERDTRHLACSQHRYTRDTLPDRCPPRFLPAGSEGRRAYQRLPALRPWRQD